jgi:hypothetical protein
VRSVPTVTLRFLPESSPVYTPVVPTKIAGSMSRVAVGVACAKADESPPEKTHTANRMKSRKVGCNPAPEDYGVMTTVSVAVWLL